ncbi:GAF domain-containing sensor histidine kinase [Janthinobacterium psychrotolerans]|uniref:histidine kinase n=1 Tax=Janthinobacterium psychrotolerans TaxID=1747903 RepID=A0A1A7C231_9BURK|nr:GAF domain-containing sensor histidine kinase [Janthinobacterium psychrotolerans]OBV40001.1 GAF domain-containing protein [Janthinobacterium psychrotolerans]
MSIPLFDVNSQEPLFDQAQRRTLAEAALRSITASTAHARGDDFLRILVRELAEALDVRYVIAGRLVRQADGAEAIRTLALWGGEGYRDNIEYSLQHTPCQDVTRQDMCFHGSGIQRRFPLDTMLADMHAESYVGMPLVDTEGCTLGILSAIDTRPIDEDKRLLALLLLSIFSARGAAELQHQERTRQLEETVRQRGESLLAAQASLLEQEQMAALGSLVAGVSHEVNTPIGVALTAASSMGSYADQLVCMLSAPKVSRTELIEIAQALTGAAALVERNLTRAAELIGNFKQLAVDQASEYVADLVLYDYVHGLVSAHSPELRKCALQVSIEIDPTCRVRLASGKLSQILSNLLMNSARHGYPDGGPGKITIRASLEAPADGKTWLLLEFCDDGIGLAPVVREHMFEPFFTTKRGKGGSGLGMHIVHTIVQQLGGQVRAVDGAAGCHIHVRLPLAA